MLNVTDYEISCDLMLRPFIDTLQFLRACAIAASENEIKRTVSEFEAMTWEDVKALPVDWCENFADLADTLEALAKRIRKALPNEGRANPDAGPA